ncbi:hypothetical protein C9374_014433 [Naegleria lovaniensis]|uniref:Uncharacterized protein n=1 Tax=Naegleria lovaniensis TaxID=51637 RepID=A0AA88KP46_NAELO|nr:uncharacterized protein C9374_014433 [Naegleria lovaniensis]KAG2389033.1 hypothetical protein C9374_014433 [Naegleria lovaniensis]
MMNFESSFSKTSSFEDFLSNVFAPNNNNTSFSNHHTFMNEDLDDNMAEFFGVNSQSDNNFLTSANQNFFETQQQPLSPSNDMLPKSSSILSLTDFKPTLSSLSRSSSATSFCGGLFQAPPSLLHNGDSSPLLSSEQQMDEFQKQLTRSGAAPFLSADSTFKPSPQLSLFKFSKQPDIFSSVTKPMSSITPSDSLLNQELFASLNDVPKCVVAESNEMDTTSTTNDAVSSSNSTTTTTNAKQQHGLPAGYKIVNGQMYNDRGYQICGFMNQHNRPCQRIGKCPFHDRMKSENVISTNSDGIISAQDSIELEHFAPSEVLKSKKKKDKKQQKSASQSSLDSTQVATTEKIETVDKPATKKPYKQGWTKEEHILFLKGLELHGKGNWKEISNIVVTRTPTQIQSHAQKYFLRQKQQKKNKRSIHDFTMDDLKKNESAEEVSMEEEGTHKRKRNKSKTSKKTSQPATVEEKSNVAAITEQEAPAVTSTTTTFDETMFKKEVFGEVFTFNNEDISLVKQFNLSPPKQDAYLEVINKLTTLKNFAKQPEQPTKSVFESFSVDELDFHFSGVSGTEAAFPSCLTEEQNNDLYDAWDVNNSFALFDSDGSFAQPFHKKQKL